MIGAIIMCITMVMEGGCEHKGELRDSSRKQDEWARVTRGAFSTRDIHTFFRLYQPKLNCSFVLDTGV